MTKRTLIAVVCLGLLGLAGCSKPASAGPDTTRVESAFATVSTAEKCEVERAVSAVRIGDYATAAAALKEAATNVRLTPAQQEALKELLTQVQAKLTDTVGAAADKAKTEADNAAKKAAQDANKAAGDLKQAVGK